MSRSERLVFLLVTSEDPSVRITVVDHALEPVAKGLSRVKVELPPGLYACRFEAGSSVREQMVSLRLGASMRVHQPPIEFASAVPLAGTGTNIPPQSDAAVDLSREVHRSLGKGAELFVFVRELDRRGRSSPARGLSVHDASGALLVDCAEEALQGGGGREGSPPWAGCTLRLTPGSYRLRSRGPRGNAIEQAIVVSKGWQTQVFLGRGLVHARARQANLSGAAVLMAPLGDGFDPSRQDLRATELARQGLRDRRAVASSEELRRMVHQKAKNPMLAMYAAHLMTHQHEPNRGLLRTVVSNLVELVGDHPDVRALEIWLGKGTRRGMRPAEAFPSPPMLKSSWSLIVQASGRRPELVPLESWSGEIGGLVLRGGPWLRWRTVPGERRPTARRAPSRPLRKALADIADALPSDPKAAAFSPIGGSPVEEAVIAYAQGLSIASSDAEVDPRSIDPAEVVRALKVPRAVVEDAATEIMARVTGPGAM